MSDKSGGSQGESEDGLPILYTKDQNGQFVPIVIEPASGEPDDDDTILVASQHRQFHSGPLPSVETFRAYGEVVASAPERILRMAEKEQDASHDYARSTIKNERHLVSQGQWMGFASMLVALCGGIYLAINGQNWVAAALVSPAVLTPIMRFYFKGRHEAQSQEADKPDE